MKPIIAGLLLFSLSTTVRAQTDLDSLAESIPFSVTACQTERVGPGQIRSGNWGVVDSVIAKLGKERALAYFKRHLHESHSQAFYSLIGIHKTGTSEDFSIALSQVRDEEILFQKGCLMIRKPLREAVLIAIRDY